MPKKKKEEPKVLLTEFLSQKQPQREVKMKAEEAPKPAENQSYEELVRGYILSKGRVSKEDLYSWSKKLGIPPVGLYRALIALEKKGIIKKTFDDILNQLVYEAIS
ncbi:MAG: hypothetical protein DRJ52_02605 [Thermoprotei archaeon]|nr:MAG: hypothetical protein DRJ52_02605 [Thermoprotei archaeon]RLE99269.1 MAG: hypothetical protein DRJ63_05875 [Thermoprotei archaeon]